MINNNNDIIYNIIVEIIYFIINEHIFIKRRFNKKKFKYNIIESFMLNPMNK